MSGSETVLVCGRSAKRGVLVWFQDGMTIDHFQIDGVVEEFSEVFNRSGFKIL